MLPSVLPPAEPRPWWGFDVLYDSAPYGNEWIINKYCQSYLVLSLCRILYLVVASEAGSKTKAASWVSEKFPQWADLIEEAQSWQYGMPMDRIADTIALIRFTVDQVTPLSVLNQSGSTMEVIKEEKEEK
jgi:hypothetical protein